MTDSIQMPVKTPSAEAEAKAALLRFLKATGRIKRISAIALELNIAKQLNRADVVTIDNVIHCYEIKTKRDTLARLERQLTAYAKSADRVTVVAATRHINTVISNVPDYVGILEIVNFGKCLDIRELRPAGNSPKWSASAALDLLPATEIRARVVKGISNKRRDILVDLAKRCDPIDIRSAVLHFLRDRYFTITRDFLSGVGRRAIKAEDLVGLRLWRAPVSSSGSELSLKATPGNDHEVYRVIGSSFGPVPEDVQQLLER